jgi:hypothetical protein
MFALPLFDIFAKGARKRRRFQENPLCTEQRHADNANDGVQSFCLVMNFQFLRY